MSKPEDVRAVTPEEVQFVRKFWVGKLVRLYHYHDEWPIASIEAVNFEKGRLKLSYHGSTVNAPDWVHYKQVRFVKAYRDKKIKPCEEKR